MVVIKDEQFFTIGEACGFLDTEAHTLRFWEKEFRDFIKPRRNGRGNRLYSLKDLETLGSIKRLLTVELYTVAGARRQMYLRQDGGAA
ncbi:MAG: MerR family transcriptional regulator [bacterium]